MDEISADMDRALPTYARDDGRSWWAKTANGDDRCVRMEYFHEHSERVRELLASDRFLRIGRLVDGDYVSRTAGNCIEALVKPIGVVEGISDVPWHKDCSLGMHSYRCCGLTCGISVTGADARSGQLRVVAGSHRALGAARVRAQQLRPAGRRPADRDRRRHRALQLHAPHVAAAGRARAPRDVHRLRPPAEGSVGEGQQRAMAAIGAVREGAYKTVSQAPGHTG